MEDKDTIIIVGATEKDQYGNLIVTPKGGGDKIRINKKHEHLHELFQQGKAVILHWEVYMNKPYVADAKLVEGELTKPQEPIEHEPMNGEPKDPVAQNIRDNMEWKQQHIEYSFWMGQLGNRIGDGSLERDYPQSHIKIKGQYYKKMSEITGVDFK